MYLNKNDSIVPPDISKVIEAAIELGTGVELTVQDEELSHDIFLHCIRSAMLAGKRIEVEVQERDWLDKIQERIHTLGWNDWVWTGADSSGWGSALRGLVERAPKGPALNDEAHLTQLRDAVDWDVEGTRRRNASLQRVLLGDKTGLDVLARYAVLRQHLHPPHHLNLDPLPGELKGDGEVYQRMHTALFQLRGFEVGEEVRKQMEVLHPVLFDMFSIEEAKAYFFDALAEGLERVHALRLELSKWMQDYEDCLTGKLIDQWAEFWQLWRRVRSDLELAQQQGHRSKRGGMNLFSRSSVAAESPIKDAYDLLRTSYAEYPIQGLIELPAFTTVEDLFRSAVSIDKAFASDSIQIKVRYFVSTQMRRLTPFNALDAFAPMSRVQSIVEGIKNTLQFVNKRQLFKEQLEDNHLYLSQKLLFLDGLYQRWNAVMSCKVDFDAYYRWRQFFEGLDQEERVVLAALAPYPQAERPMRYELWYYRYLLQVIAGEGKLFRLRDSRELLKRYKRWARAQLGYRVSRYMADISHRIVELTKRDKSLRRWMKTGEDDLLSEDNKTRIEGWLPVVMHYCTPEGRPGSRGQGGLLEIGVRQGGERRLRYYPSSSEAASEPPTMQEVHCAGPAIRPTAKNVLLSKHSDRWKEVKRLAAYFHAYLQNGIVYEDAGPNIVFSYIPNRRLERLLLNAMGKEWQGTPITELTEKQIAERLLEDRATLTLLCVEELLVAGEEERDMVWNAHLFGLIAHSGMEVRVLALSDYNREMLFLNSSDMKSQSSVV